MLVKSPSYSREHPVILFDGVCGLCNSFVDLIIKFDKQEIFRYAPLQSNAGIELRKKYCEHYGPVDTIILIDNNCYIKARALRRILKKIKKLYPFYLLSRALPIFLVDILYDVIARGRYKLFGKYETCRLPDERERKLFLE